MRIQNFAFLFTLLISFSVNAVGVSKDYCKRLLSDSARNIERIASVNTLYLGYNISENGEPLPKGQRAWKAKDPAKVDALGDMMKVVDADYFVLQEVYGLKDLQKFNAEELGGAYLPILIDGNDVNGSDIGFLVRRSLGYKYQLETHKDEVWVDPANGEEMKLFSRDAPALLVMKPGQQSPHKIIIGNHAKSKRDRDGDKESTRLRTAQYNRIAEIVEEYRVLYPTTPIFIVGDFNTPINSKEVAALNRIAKNAFIMVKPPVTGPDSYTHSYFSPNGPAEHRQIDAVLVVQGLGVEVVKAGVYRAEKPLPKTFKEREKQPSDHSIPFADVMASEISSSASKSSQAPPKK